MTVALFFGCIFVTLRPPSIPLEFQVLIVVLVFAVKAGWYTTAAWA